MTSAKGKKPSVETGPEVFKHSGFTSRNASPTAQIIKKSLISALKHYTSNISTSALSKRELCQLLNSLHFVKGEISPEDQENIVYMWKTISKNHQTSLPDAISYLLCILDLSIPKSLLVNSMVFQYVPISDYGYLKPNSLSLLKNYLEFIYAKSSKSQNSLINPAMETPFFISPPRVKTPKTTTPSRAETPKVPEFRRKIEKKMDPKVPKSKSKIRLKRSVSGIGSKIHTKGFSVYGNCEKREKSPVISIETSTHAGKANKMVFYNEDTRQKVRITINL